jgi:hypothetical protein
MTTEVRNSGKFIAQRVGWIKRRRIHLFTYESLGLRPGQIMVLHFEQIATDQTSEAVPI